jgi:hypothetical protein
MTRYLAIHFPAEWRILNIFSREILILRKLTTRAFEEKQQPCGARIFEFWRGFGAEAG